MEFQKNIRVQPKTESNEQTWRGVSARIKSGNKQRGRGDGKTYIKFLGRHLHRVVAEKMIGRGLKPGEVVHHLDGNIRNNCPENLMVLKSQSNMQKYIFQKKSEVVPMNISRGKAAALLMEMG